MNQVDTLERAEVEHGNAGGVVTSGTPFRILALDGGGAKGFYTLGVLSEIEALVGTPLSSNFDLIFGTSTGSIIAALLARGESVSKIRALYEEKVPAIMSACNTTVRTRLLHSAVREIFKDD